MTKTIAVLGGTGKEGSGLAVRWALNGYKVIIGSRALEKAQTVVAELNPNTPDNPILGMENADAAKAAELAILTVPYSAQKATLEGVKAQLSGKILVDVTVPLLPPDVTKVNVPEGKAACLESQALLDNSVRVVGAFQNVSAVKLKQYGEDIDCDVLVCGDDESAKLEVMQLVIAAGMRGIDAGPLANAVAVEAMTAVLLYINRRYGVKGAGIRITGVE